MLDKDGGVPGDRGVLVSHFLIAFAIHYGLENLTSSHNYPLEEMLTARSWAPG